MNQHNAVSLERASNRNPNILIVDSRSLLRGLLRSSIENLDPKITATEVGSVSEALRRISEGNKYDLILLHAESPDVAEQVELGELRRGAANVPVVMLSDISDVDFIAGAFHAGAKGFIPTTLDSRVVVDSLRLVSDGGVYIPEAVIDLLNAHYEANCRPSPLEASRSAGALGLTRRQRQVLEALRNGQSNKLIAHQLGISENTVKVHLSQIMKKLRVNNRTEAVLTAFGPMTRRAERKPVRREN